MIFAKDRKIDRLGQNFYPILLQVANVLNSQRKTNPMPSDAPSVMTMHRLDSPHLVRGEVIRVDETGYLVRDLAGRDVRLQTTSASVRNDIIRVGDKIIADTGSSSTVHVDSIAKT
jgi:hypothetical protein